MERRQTSVTTGPASPEPLSRTPAPVARALAFVALNVTVVALYLEWLCSVLPPLSGEGRSLVIVPVSAIALVAFAAMYPLLRRADTHLARLGVLAGFIVLGVAAFTGLVLASFGAPEPTVRSAALFAFLVVLAQLIYGAPLFLGIAVVNKLLSPILLARPVRAWV